MQDPTLAVAANRLDVCQKIGSLDVPAPVKHRALSALEGRSAEAEEMRLRLGFSEEEVAAARADLDAAKADAVEAFHERETRAAIRDEATTPRRAVGIDIYAPLEEDATLAPPARRALSPADIVRSWQAEGPLVRVPTGIVTLDSLCRGGLPIPWRVVIVGAPAAGKTFVEAVIGRYLAAAGYFVGILGVDEEPEDLTVRLVQQAGFHIEEAERRDPSTLDAMAVALSTLPLRFYDHTWTIEAAAADLAAGCAVDGRKGALFLDSLHAVTSEAALDLGGDPSERVRLAANVAAMRAASTTHRLLVVATAEANRASYRSEAAAAEGNDMASGAETRAIEYAAQTLLMLRTPKGHPDVTHVRVVKNRRAFTGEFWLRLDRDAHSVSECPNPADDPSAAMEREQGKREAQRGRVAADANLLRTILADHHEGLGERAMRAAVATAGHQWGRDRLEAARHALAAGVGGVRAVDRGTPRQARWVLESVSAPQ